MITIKPDVIVKYKSSFCDLYACHDEKLTSDILFIYVQQMQAVWLCLPSVTSRSLKIQSCFYQFQENLGLAIYCLLWYAIVQ